MADSLWIIPFGRYKGVPIEDVPAQYLEWLMGEGWFLERFRDGVEPVRQELKYRERFA